MAEERFSNEAFSTIQELNDGDLDKSNGMGGGGNWSDSSYTLRIESRRFVNRLDLYCGKIMVMKGDS